MDGECLSLPLSYSLVPHEGAWRAEAEQAAPYLSDVRFALAAYDEAKARAVPAVEFATVVECAELAELLRLHRCGGHKVPYPGEDGGFVEPLEATRWLVKRRKVFLFASVKQVFPAAVVAFFDARPWWPEAAAQLETHDAVSRAFNRLLSLRWRVDQCLAEVARRTDEAKREAARRAVAEAKAKVRRAVSDAAVSRSEFLGFAVLDSEPFRDERPRWLYVLLGQDGALYCGSALSVRARLRAHRRGTAAAVTRDRRQAWHLLHAERLPIGQAALCGEFALLHSQWLQRSLLADREPRARRLHAREGCAVPWLGLSMSVRGVR